MMEDKEQKNSLVANLQHDWPLSFHTLLIKNQPFRYLREKKVVEASDAASDYMTPDLSASAGEEKSFYREVSWQRLESFRSVNLKTWAKMELERFLESSGTKNPAYWLAVAKRFQAVEDWPDLVHWAERYFDLDQKTMDLKNPLIRFHYPKAHLNEVLRASKEFNVSPFLIWGVMREESRFEADVISHAGAVGLLQLLPSLAMRIGRNLGDSPGQRALLTDPRRNIRYGAYHLSELNQRVSTLDVPENLKPILQIASYNAGIEAVLRWIDEKDTKRIDGFVESIPYAETRLYVKHVLQSAYIYYRLYGDVTKEVARTKNESEL